MSLNPKIQNWRGKVVWLVGASTGIGYALAQSLHQQGASVIVSARNVAKLNAFVAEHPGSTAIALDVTDVQQVASAVDRIWAMHAQIDVLFYCAGFYSPQTASTATPPFDEHAMQQHMALNFTGALTVLHASLPKAKHIALVASVAGYQTLPNALAYAPSKAAMQRLAEGLYIDLHRQGVGVTLINPGFVETPMTAQNDFHMPALITADAAAKAIIQGMAAGVFEIHFPKRFTLWVKLLSMLPYRLYFAICRAITQKAAA
jgi:NAD(P)-dependent dehydrogenase (short-subunit alcohol dehydrogenase family)